jgi:hypothetical protein
MLRIKSRVEKSSSLVFFAFNTLETPQDEVLNGVVHAH